MPYILGSFGVHCNSDYIKKMSTIALREGSEKTLQTMPLENGILFAGYKRDENYQYDRIMPLPAHQGIMVGKLFDRDHYNDVHFNDELAHNFINDPKKISASCWGRYSGALYNKTTKAITLIRDPQGLSTLFYSVIPGGILFSTELALLYAALEHKPAIDMTYFAHYLIHTNHALASTPFEGIKELLPGMSLRMDSHGECSHELLWDTSGLHGSFITDPKNVEEELLATLRSCTKAWVGQAPGVCVQLSGGTDSSGLMLLLRDVLPASTKLIAVNYIDSKTQSSNEIEYAQEIADICDSLLYFLDSQASSLFDKLPQNFLPNRPSTLLLSFNSSRQLNELAIQHNCPEIMNGQGGDHVFLAPPPKYALADYWLERGIRDITSPLNTLSGIYRAPWLSLVHDNAKAVTSYYRNSRYIKREETPYLDKNFINKLEPQDFYLNTILKNFHPGKATHIESLCHAVSYSERDQSSLHSCLTHPLLSQPVIELGLKIPTYQSFHDGYDRIFFRRAVSRLKNSKSLWRRIKGQTTGSVVKECASHAHEIRDILLHGKLIASGMIHRHWYEQEITKIQHGYSENIWPILHLLTAELWFKQWQLD